MNACVLTLILCQKSAIEIGFIVVIVNHWLVYSVHKLEAARF